MDAYNRKIVTLRTPSSELAFGKWSLEKPGKGDSIPSNIYFSRPEPTDTQKGLLRQVHQRLLLTNAKDVLVLLAGPEAYLGETKPERIYGLSHDPSAMEANHRLSFRVSHDLNEKPTLPFLDAEFDAVILPIHIGLLRHPIEVAREAGRVLKGGGVFITTFLQPYFADDYTRMWVLGDDSDHVTVVDAIYEYARTFTPSTILSLCRTGNDLRWNLGGLPPDSDPEKAIWAVWAHKDRIPAEMAVHPPFPVQRRIPSVEKSDVRYDTQGRPLCPYCHNPMHRIAPPVTVFEIDYGVNELFVCFEDTCDYHKRSRSWMRAQGQRGFSYRFMVNPENGAIGPIPDDLVGGLASSRIE